MCMFVIYVALCASKKFLTVVQISRLYSGARVCKTYPGSAAAMTQLYRDSSLVQSPHFENAIVKIRR